MTVKKKPHTREIDLDAAHKARAEKADDPPAVVLGGERFVLPRSLPALVIVGLARAHREEPGGLEDALAGLFGDQMDRALSLGLELEDLDVILEGAYGEDPGEASASAS